MKPFQLLMTVDLHDGGEPVPVVVDLLAPKGVKLKETPTRPRPPRPTGRWLRGRPAKPHQQANQGQHVGGRLNTVELIPTLLVMKGYALCGRDKMKDAYDIYYSVRNYLGGATKLGEGCKPLLEDMLAAEVSRILATKFGGREDFGPTTVRIFLEEAAPEFTDMEPEQIQTDAFGQVDSFLRALGIR